MFISIVLRNAEHRLPDFLAALTAQDHPKERISLHFVTSNNEDGTAEALERWCRAERQRNQYASVTLDARPATEPPPPEGWRTADECRYQPHCWTKARYAHVAVLREEALALARAQEYRYFLSLDSDVLLTNRRTISAMVAKRHPVVSPQLYAHPNQYDSNVWLAVAADGFYTSHPHQEAFRGTVALKGCVQAAAAHSFVLVDLRARGAHRVRFRNESLTADTGALAYSGVPIFGCNDQHYGFTASVAGVNSDATHETEARHWQKLVQLRTGKRGSYDRVVPRFAAAADDDKPCAEGTALRNQLDELRQDVLVRLNRAEAAGARVNCRWNGDCDPSRFKVDRRANLTLREFAEQYAMQRLPVVITDYVGAGRMSTTGEVWDEAFWRRRCGERKVYVQRPAKAATWGGLDGVGSWPLNEVFSMLEAAAAAGKPPSELYGVFDAPLKSWCAEVLHEYVMPQYFANDVMQRVPPETPLTYRDSWPSFFLGRNGTRANLHVDMFGSSFWMALFKGRKHWRFVDESERALLYEDRHTHNFPGVDLFEPDYERFPLLRHVRVFDVVLQPGELLFVPGGSPHQVANVGDTISLAGNYVDLASLETCRAEVDHPDRRGASRYTELLQTILKDGFDAAMDYEIGDLPWAAFKAQGAV